MDAKKLLHPKDRVKIVGLMIVAFFLLLLFVNCVSPVGRVRVNGESMLPTIKDGAYVTIESPKDLKTGDIIIFQADTRKEFYCKRILALPGDTVEIKDGTVFVNGKAKEEEGGFPKELESISYPITLNDEEYFVMGDNRAYSVDSRDKRIGPVIKETIIGKVVSID